MDSRLYLVRSSSIITSRWMSLALGVLLLTVVPERVSAQDLSIGGRLGLVGGEVYFEDKDADDLSSPKPGLQMGGVAAYRLGPVISLQAELWYVQKGWNETLYGGGRRLSYLEMPLLVVVTAPWKTAPQLIAGASVGVELACSVTGVPHVGCVDCSDPRVKWLHRKLQFATWFGFGVRRRFGASQLQVQFLGNYNLTNLNREPLPRGWARLFSGALSVAYLVPLGGTRP